MSQAGDYGERKSEPWTYRSRLLPLRTYSGRVVYRRHKHYFTVRDAARIMAKLEPPEGSDGQSWTLNIISTLRMATLAMLQRILFFLPPGVIGELYDWGIGILDKLFYQTSGYKDASRTIEKAVSLINYAALQAGLTVKIERPKPPKS